MTTLTASDCAGHYTMAAPRTHILLNNNNSLSTSMKRFKEAQIFKYCLFLGMPQIMPVALPVICSWGETCDAKSELVTLMDYQILSFHLEIEMCICPQCNDKT